VFTLTSSRIVVDISAFKENNFKLSLKGFTILLWP
jgi:hypothetical protein